MHQDSPDFRTDSTGYGSRLPQHQLAAVILLLSKSKAPLPGPCLIPVPRADYWVVVTEVGPVPVTVDPTGVNAPVAVLIL